MAKFQIKILIIFVADDLKHPSFCKCWIDLYYIFCVMHTKDPILMGLRTP